MSDVSFLSVLLIALGLSADCLAVALSSSLARKTLSFVPILRISLSFGAFQAVMPVLGWFAGRTIVELVASYDHWLAFALLAFVGGKMVWQSFQHKEPGAIANDVTRGLTLLILSVATSIDALAIGLSFAFLEMNIMFAATAIGIVAFTVTTIGFIVGKRIGKLAGQRAGAVGGTILVGIGIKIVLEHIL